MSSPATSNPYGPYLVEGDRRRRFPQIQCCNCVLVALGCIAVGLAVSQFTRIGLDNYRLVDLRLVEGLLLILAGVVGLLCVRGNHGSIVLKALYVLSIVISLAALVFYIDTLWRVVDSLQELSRMERTRGIMLSSVWNWNLDVYPGKIAVASVMILVAGVGALVGVIALIQLERMVMVERPGYQHGTREEHSRLKRNTTQLTTVAVLKFFVAVASLALAVYLEWLHQSLGGRDNYIKVALDHLAAMFAIASTLIDMYACFNRRHSSLNLKVSTVLGIVSAVWCLKTIDNNMFPYYRTDLNNYRMSMNLNQYDMPLARASTQYVVVAIHAALLTSFSVLFLLCALTSILAASCWRENAVGDTVVVGPAKSYYDPSTGEMQQYRGAFDDDEWDGGGGEALGPQSSLLTSLHLFWSICLMVLVVMGLVELPWSGDFIGGDLLWLAVLFFATAVLFSTHPTVNTHVKFLMNACAFGVALEKLIASANLVVQSAANANYRNDNVTDGRTYTGQIVLHSIQCALLFGETATALAGTCVFGSRLRTPRGLGRHSGSGLLLCLGAPFSLLYAVVMTTSYVLFELGKWRYAEVPLEVPFFRISNGPLAAVVFVVQLAAAVSTRYLLAATLLQLVLSSIALFTLSSAVTNVYYLQIIIQLREQIGMGWSERLILIVALLLAALAVLVCVLTVVAGVLYLLRSSYIFHHLRLAEPNALYGYAYSVAPATLPAVATSAFPASPMPPLTGSTVAAEPSPTSYVATEAIDGGHKWSSSDVASILTHAPHPGSPVPPSRGTAKLANYELWSRSPTTTEPASMGNNWKGIRLLPSLRFGPDGDPPPLTTPASPHSTGTHQFSLQPQEEQTLYWSAEENPYIYKSTKRYLGHPRGDCDATSEGTTVAPHYANSPEEADGYANVRSPQPSSESPTRRLVSRKQDERWRVEGDGTGRHSVGTQTRLPRTVFHDFV